MRFAALLVWLAAGAFAQEGATVLGTVANSATHTGLGGVAVTLWTQQGVHYNATTDETGAYQISGMTPGRYFSRFEKNGFVEVSRDGPSANSALPVGAGGTPIRLDTELVPLATVRGRVVDPEGRPAADVEVGFDRFNTVTTGADGQFVLHDQRPGSYTLLARPKTTETATREQQRTEVVPTFYASAVDRAQAAPVVVRGGDDLSGFEIRLQTSVVYRVRGVVLQQNGKPLARADVRLLSLSRQQGLGGQMTFGGGSVGYYVGSPRSETETEEASVTSNDEGAFEFPSVRPGEWELRAESEPKRDSARNFTLAQSETVSVMVTDRDLDDVRLRFPETFTLQATVDWGDRPPGESARARVMLLLLQADGAVGGLPRIPMRTGDVLRFENVAAGRYRIELLPGIPQGYYPAAVLLEGRDVLGEPVDLNAATPPLRLVYRPNAGTSRGTVEKGEGATVLLWPQSAGAPEVVRLARAGAGGVFDLTSVPPGDYYLLAVDRQNLTRAPQEVIRSFPQGAASVHVDENATPSVALPLTHLPE